MGYAWGAPVSTPETGIAKITADAIDQAQAIVAVAAAEERQASFLDPVTPDEMIEAQEELGPDAGKISVLAHARARKRGRPPGARNRRNDDLVKYLSQFGPDPAVTMMITQATDPHVLIEQSRRMVQKVQKNGSIIMVEETMSYAEAMALRTRCAEGLIPYFHSKRPIAADLTIRHDGDLIIAGTTHSREQVQDIVEAEFMSVDGIDPEFDEGEEAA